MRIDSQSQVMDQTASIKTTEPQTVKAIEVKEQPLPIPSLESEPEVSKEKLQQAVDAVNDFFENNHSELKFLFHEGLEQYYVQLVNSETEEVVREIPSKKLLDVYYEMQKLVGMIVDEKI